IRLAAPPLDGSVQMLPCMSIASVRPSGDTPTDIEVPSETVTSIGGRTGAASSATRPIVATIDAVRIMELFLPILPLPPIQPSRAFYRCYDPPAVNNPFDFSGATAVVVGGATGLGQAMAEGLAVHGATVCVVSRSEQK